MPYEIAGRPNLPDAIRKDFDEFISDLITNNIPQVRVLFGFAWGNYIYEKDWLELTLTPLELKEKVEQAEINKDGSISKDDLYITLPHLACERLYCHEADIHITSDTNSPYLQAQIIKWLDLGWEVFEKHGKEWKKIKGTEQGAAANP